MNSILTLVLAAALSTPVLASDLVITKEKHSDAVKVMGQDRPAKDTKEVVWIGKDRMRVEEGDKVTIVRTDLKKLYILDTKAKTRTSLDLPLDLKKYIPADTAPMMEQMMSQMKVTVTPTTETKKIKDWNATKYTMAVTLPMGGTATQEMWVTKDVGGDRAGWQDMFAALMSASPFSAAMAAEMKKVDGLPVLSERTQTMMGSEMKSREAVLSVEQKEAAADFYDAPKDFTDKPFDPMAEVMRK
jgi:uncharacterized protein DUF4412